MKNGSARRVAPYLLVSLVMLAPEAWAYLDPSTGSLILSSIVGMLAAAGLALKTYWYKLKRVFRRQDQAADDKGAPESGGGPGPNPGPNPGPG